MSSLPTLNSRPTNRERMIGLAMSPLFTSSHFKDLVFECARCAAPFLSLTRDGRAVELRVTPTSKKGSRIENDCKNAGTEDKLSTARRNGKTVSDHVRQREGGCVKKCTKDKLSTAQERKRGAVSVHVR